MAMREDHASRAFSERRTQDLPRMHQSRRLCADGHEMGQEQVKLRIDQDRPEVFAIVVGIFQEVPGEPRHGQGAIQRAR
jgi:hypothetical protein